MEDYEALAALYVETQQWERVGAVNIAKYVCACHHYVLILSGFWTGREQARFEGAVQISWTYVVFLSTC